MRYSRQIALDKIGKKNQEKLSKKTITILGLGAIGSVTAELLARSGINLILIDHDKIDITNLQRQLLYTEKDINQYKVNIASKKLKEINSTIKIKTHKKCLTNKNLKILNSDLILDCSDNLETRFLINKYSLKTKIPWIHTAALKTRTVLYNFIQNKNNTRPCFNCLYKKNSEFETCEDSGILNTVTTLIATLQATQALKALLNYKYEDKLLRINIWDNSIEKLTVKKDKNCKTCTMDVKTKKIEVGKFTLKLCKTKSAYSVKPFRNVRLNLNEIKDMYEPIIETPLLLIVKIKKYEVIVHNYGELIFKDLKNEAMIKKIAKEIYTLADSSKLKQKIKQKH